MKKERQEKPRRTGGKRKERRKRERGGGRGRQERGVRLERERGK